METQDEPSDTFRPVAAARSDTKPAYTYVVALRKEYLDIYDAFTGHVLRSLPDWLRVGKSRRWAEHKVITGGGHYVVYCSFADDDFYIMDFQTGHEIEPERVNVFQTEATYGTIDREDHIKEMTIIESTQQLVICNGRTHDFIIYDLPKRQWVVNIASHKDCEVMNLHVCQPQGKAKRLYFSSEFTVSNVNLFSHEVETQFKHPCKIKSLASRDGRLIVTVAADNIIRIWDTQMAPFVHDLSEFTGQVYVASDALRNQVTSQVSDAASADAVTSALTAKGVENYWTRDPQNPPIDVKTRLLPFPGNERYVCVTQNCEDAGRILQWTICVSIFDLSTMTCMRRVFLPEKVDGSLTTLLYVHCFADKEHLLIEENELTNNFRLVNVHTWQESSKKLVLTEEAKKVWRRQVANLEAVEVVAIELAYDKLALLCPGPWKHFKSLSVNEECQSWLFKHIRVDRAAPFRNEKMVLHKFDQVEACAYTKRIVALWGGSILLIWTDDGYLVSVLKLYDKFKDFSPLRDHLTVTMCTGRGGVIITSGQSVSKSDSKSKDKHSLLVELEKGEVCGFLLSNVSKISKDVLDSVEQTQLILRGASEHAHRGVDVPQRSLRWVAFDSNNQVSLLYEVKVSSMVNRMMSSSDGRKCITWCSDDKENTLSLWTTQKGLQTRATFTADHMTDAALLLSSTKDIIINSPIGLIRLELNKGAHYDLGQPPELFTDKDLNVIIPEFS